MFMDKVNLNFRVGAHHKTSKLKHRKFYFINLTKLTVWGQYISNYKVQRLSVLSQEEYLRLCKNNSKINYFFPPPLPPHIPAPSTQAKKQEESCFSIQNRQIANTNRKETFRTNPNHDYTSWSCSFTETDFRYNKSVCVNPPFKNPWLPIRGH